MDGESEGGAWPRHGRDDGASGQIHCFHSLFIEMLVPCWVKNVDFNHYFEGKINA